MRGWRATLRRKGIAVVSVSVIAAHTLLSLAVFSPSAHAYALLVQTKSAAANSTTVSATFSPTAGVNHLLIAVCASRVNATLSVTGFTAAKNQAGTPSQGIFYKVSAGTETTVTCTATATGRMAIHIYEYSGTLATAPLDTVNAVTSTGNSTAVASGSLTTTNANDMIFAATSINSNSTYSAWSNTFTERNDLLSGTQLHTGAADRYVTATGTYTTTATATATGAWRGQIAAFKLLPIQLTADIVDASGLSVSAPSVAFSAANFNFACQTVTGTLGVASQKIRVSNTTPTGWLLSIGATSGPTAIWSDGGTNTYDYNDPGGTGCTDSTDTDTVGGQMTVNPAASTLTPVAPCTVTNVTKGTSVAFSQGVTDSISLLSATAAAMANCTWDLTGITLSQKIPGEQQGANYSLGLTLTLIAQ